MRIVAKLQREVLGKPVISSKLIKRLITVILSISLSFSNIFVIDILAKENNQLETNIHEITQLLEEIFETQYKEKEEDIKQIIMDRSYDYTMTMESFYQKVNPFQGIDYLELISVYTTIKDYINRHGIDIREGIAGISFLEMSVEEKMIEQIKPILVPVYKETEEGYYIQDGIRRIEKETSLKKYDTLDGEKYYEVGEYVVTPKQETVYFAEVELKYRGTEAIYEYYGIEPTVLQNEMKKIKDILSKEVLNETLIQSVFVQTPKTDEILTEEITQKIHSLTKDLQGTEALVIKTALSLIGQVPYQWGGKPQKAGYDTSWWLYDEMGQQRGLDCSGFVQWVYWTAGFDEETVKQVKSSWDMMGLEDVPFEELRPGDIGILNHNETTNHVGIYLGDNLFIHCSSGKRTVTVSEFPFTYYKTVQNNGKINVDNLEERTYSEDIYTESIIEKELYSKDVVIDTEMERDVYILAQLMIHEAGNQGYNGKVAIGEVVLNRCNSPQFAEVTIPEVIYAPEQFSYVEEIQYINPDEETLDIARMVLQEKVKIFNEPKVLYFRNPMITDGILPSQPYDWGRLKWYAYVNDHAFYISE